MNTNHESPITEFVLYWVLNPGLSDARKMNEREKTFPATRAQLSYALDYRDHERIELRGRYGDATCHLYARMGEGDVSIDEIGEARAYELLTAAGELNPNDVRALRGDVWDGNNWVSFHPSRAYAALADEHSWERDGHALIRWDEDGGADVRLDDGWDWLDSTDDETLGALTSGGVEWEEYEELSALYDDRQIAVNLAQYEAWASGRAESVAKSA